MALAACLHFDVSTPNFLIQEAFAEFDVPWRNDLVGGWNPIKNGEFVLGDAPGLGLELDERPSPSHPYVAQRVSQPVGPRLADEFHAEPVTDEGVTSRPLPDFRIALTGDSRRVRGRRLRRRRARPRWRAVPYIRWHFMTDLAPKPGDPGYWSRLYSLEVSAGAHPRRRRPGGAASLGEAEHVRRGRGRPVS